MPREKEPEEKTPDCGDESSWAEDQKENTYYYDDAHGYETFDPNADDDDGDEDDRDQASTKLTESTVMPLQKR